MIPPKLGQVLGDNTRYVASYSNNNRLSSFWIAMKKLIKWFV